MFTTSVYFFKKLLNTLIKTMDTCVVLYMLLNYSVICAFFAASSTLIIRLWTAEATAPLHSASLGFTIGAAITPQLIRPFLSPEKSYDQHNGTNIASNGSTELPGLYTGVDTFEDLSQIEIPYMIIGLILVVFGIVFFGFYFKGPPNGFEQDKVDNKKKASFRSMINPASCGRGSFNYGIQLLICLFLYYFLIIAILCSLRFLFAFAIESSVRFTKSEATMLITTFFSCALAARVLSVIFIKFIRINIYLIVDILVVTAGCVVMAIFGHYVREVLWACVVLLGLSTSQMWPNGTSWANR